MKNLSIVSFLWILLFLIGESVDLQAQSRANARFAQNAEIYKPNSNNRKIKELDVQLPMRFNTQRMKVEIVDQMAIYEGDIVLGHEAEFNGEVSFAIAIAHNDYRWENGIMPYVLSPEHPRKAEIIEAIDHINKKTKICMVERTNERDYVNFLSGSGCWSYVGRQTYEQPINIGNCSLGSIIHEICHAAGLYHEQSRSDRDQFIEIKWENISEHRKQNFNKKDETGMDIGAYDFASVMHYPATAFSKNGQPTIVSKVPAKAFGQRDGLSPMDINALNSLYSNAEGCGNEEVVVNPPTTGTGGETGTSPTTTEPATGGGTGTTTTTVVPTTGIGGGTTTKPPTIGSGRGTTTTTTTTTQPTGSRGNRGRSNRVGTTIGKNTTTRNIISKKTISTNHLPSSTPKPIEGKVSFYSETNYQGKYIHLSPGSYNVSQLLQRMQAKDVFSVLVGDEVIVEFYLKDRSKKALSESLPKLTDFKERYQMIVIKPKK